MKLFRYIAFSTALILSINLIAQNNYPYQYISPKPSSIMVSHKSNIILKQGDIIDKSTLDSRLFAVEGSKSGLHAGHLILSDDHRTIVFNPAEAFAGDEVVTVTQRVGLKTRNGDSVPEWSFEYRTAPLGISQIHDSEIDDDIFKDRSHFTPVSHESNILSTLPAPPITIDSVDNPSPGYIFMATWDRNVPTKYGNFIFVLDSAGVLVDSVRVTGAPYDFQVQPNGYLSYALGAFSSFVPLPGEELQHMVLDDNLAVIDSFKMKNGYITDFHEFKMLPNGHVMMMSYHTIIYDMSKIIEGGKTDASLVINIIQEQDKDKNVVFEWRNIDYIPITDSDLDLTTQRINYGTLNAFDIDTDGNILASFRNHSEIMKINKSTGELMWRMGGPRGEFTFVGENEVNAPYYHSRQHNIRRRPNGNITLFDNGQHHLPPYSRAVEYSLDEVNKVATLVSDWRYPNGNIFCVTAGNAEPLPDGGWFIGYGVPNPVAPFIQRNAVETHADGSIALEMSLPQNVLAYRAYKLPWREFVTNPIYSHFEVTSGNTYSFNNESTQTGIEVEYLSLSAADYNQVTIERKPYGPTQPEFIHKNMTVSPVSIIYSGAAISSQTAKFYFDLTQYPEIIDPENTIIYYRNFPDQGLFIPTVTTFNSIENQLTANISGFGEIVFGVQSTGLGTNTPILYEPRDDQKIILQDTISIQWTGKGVYDSFNVQLSTDSSFSNIIHELNTNLSYTSLTDLSNNTEYFWRVNSVLDGDTSLWAEAWRFEVADPYISAISPNGGEIWTSGDSEIIRWETNLLDNISIALLNEQSLILSLDTVVASLQAYEWDIPEDLNAGEDYKIRLRSESDSSISGLSQEVFTINSSVSIMTDNNIPDKFTLHQNYPNPFNPTTSIQYELPESMDISLTIYDVSGREIKTLINRIQSAGWYSIDWDGLDSNDNSVDTGIYLARLQSKNLSWVIKMVYLK